jgi:hypothetical protein
MKKRKRGRESGRGREEELKTLAPKNEECIRGWVTVRRELEQKDRSDAHVVYSQWEQAT